MNEDKPYKGKGDDGMFKQHKESKTTTNRSSSAYNSIVLQPKACGDVSKEREIPISKTSLFKLRNTMSKDASRDLLSSQDKPHRS